MLPAAAATLRLGLFQRFLFDRRLHAGKSLEGLRRNQGQQVQRPAGLGGAARGEAQRDSASSVSSMITR